MSALFAAEEKSVDHMHAFCSTVLKELEAAVTGDGVAQEGMEKAVMEITLIMRGILTISASSVDDVCDDAVNYLNSGGDSTAKVPLTNVAYAVDNATLWKDALGEYLDKREANNRSLPRLLEPIESRGAFSRGCSG